MIAFEEYLMSTILCKNIENHLALNRGFGKSHFIQNLTISMMLANLEILALQLEIDDISTFKSNSKKIDCQEMIKSNRLDTNPCDTTVWKSTLWQSISAPPSPTSLPLQSPYILKDTQKSIPILSCLKSQNGKFQSSLLQPSQWSLLDNEECNENNEWLLNTLNCKQGLIGTNMKLDLDAIQRNRDTCERTELQIKRDKFAYFDKECSQILEHVYLGSEAVARNWETLYKNGITHVLNCVGFVCPEYFPKDLSYKVLWLQDSPIEDITSILYDVFDYFEEVREQGGRIFVHCCQGVSRSTSLVIAYLMWVGKHTFEDAFQLVKATRGVTNPNMGFACQLLQCQKRMHAIPFSPKSTLRMYRIASHSLYDPMHLVPKKVSNPHSAALDSRGAFVVLAPNTLFVWQGLKCDSNMAFKAYQFIGQVIQYEKAKGHMFYILERQEPEEFWNAFKKKESFSNATISFKNVTNENGLLTLEENSQTICEPKLHIKNIPLYDKDFEIYMKAKFDQIKPKNNYNELSFMNLGPRDGGWTKLPKRNIENFENVSFENHKDLYKNIDFEDKKIMALDEIKLGDCKETETILKSPSSPNAPQCPSTSSLSLHSFLSNPSHSPPIITLPSSSLQPSPTSIVVDAPLEKSLYILPSTKIDPIFSTLETFISTPPLLSLPFRSSTNLENNNEVVESYLCNSIDKDALSSKINSNISLTSNKSTNEYGRVASQPNNVRYQRDVATKFFEQISTSCIENERLDSSFEACCSFQNKDKGESSSSGCRMKQRDEEFAPILFEWPQMEKIDMFDADDLDSDGAFVLLVLDEYNKNQNCLYLWVGSSLQSKEDQNSSVYDDNIGEKNIKHWQNIGKDLIHQLQLQKDTLVELVFDGKEPNEFWDYFING